MPALCLMLSETYYAQNYAGIIGLGLAITNLYIKYFRSVFYISVPHFIQSIALAFEHP